MSAAQVLAAKIVIGKSISDLKSTVHTAREAAAITHRHSVTLGSEDANLLIISGS